MTGRPADSWEGCAAVELAARWGAQSVHLYEVVGSTNDVARQLRVEHGGLPSVVLAEEQQAGRGRAGRGWASAPGLGLWVSVVAPPRPDAGVSLPLRVGLAVAAALDSFVGSGSVGLKWPNDLWIGERKLGGILCEAAWVGSAPAGVVAGVGLNVLHRPDDFPPEVRTGATSVRMVTGQAPDRLAIADRVVPAVIRALAGEGDLDPDLFAQRDLLRGRRVVVSDPMTGRTVARGVADGIDREGALILMTDQGLQVVRSGTVRPADVFGPSRGRSRLAQPSDPASAPPEGAER